MAPTILLVTVFTLYTDSLFIFFFRFTCSPLYFFAFFFAESLNGYSHNDIAYRKLSKTIEMI